MIRMIVKGSIQNPQKIIDSALIWFYISLVLSVQEFGVSEKKMY